MKNLIVPMLLFTIFPLAAQAKPKMPSHIETVGISDCDAYIAKGWDCRIEHHCEDGKAKDEGWCRMSESHLSMVSTMWKLKAQKNSAATKEKCQKELKEARENKQWHCKW